MTVFCLPAGPHLRGEMWGTRFVVETLGSGGLGAVFCLLAYPHLRGEMWGTGVSGGGE